MTVANEPTSVIVHPVSGECECNGLTKREYFAAMAMQGLLSGRMNGAPEIVPHIYTDTAVMYADQLIKSLNK